MTLVISLAWSSDCKKLLSNTLPGRFSIYLRHSCAVGNISWRSKWKQSIFDGGHVLMPSTSIATAGSSVCSDYASLATSVSSDITTGLLVFVAIAATTAFDCFFRASRLLDCALREDHWFLIFISPLTAIGRQQESFGPKCGEEKFECIVIYLPVFT